MRYDALIEESLCYKTVRALYRYFLASVFFRVFIGSARAAYRVSCEIMRNSESRRLFISYRSACNDKIRYLISASIISILGCYILTGYLVYGKIRYMPMLLLSVILFAGYLVRNGAIGYIVSIYRNSYTFQVLNKKI